MRKLNDWIESWKIYREEVSESPKLYNDWVAVSIISAVLQRKTYLSWDSRIYPNFYIVLVGPAGKARKGSAMSPGNSILRELGIKLTAESTTREALIRNLRKSSATFTGDDGTIHMYSALTVYSEEFTTFIGYNNRQLMADLANWWDCPNIWTYDTKNKGTDQIDGVFVNIIGATTPDIFRRALPEDAVGGGLLSRTICVYEDEKSQLVIFPSEGDKELRDLLFEDLNSIAAINGKFDTDDSFKKIYAKWYPFQHKELKFEDDRLSAYIERRSTHLRKLAMIFNASRNGNNIITKEDFDNALDLLTRTEKKMAYTFRGLGSSDKAEVIQKIMQFIGMKEEVTYKELTRRFINDIDEEKMPIILATLEKAEYIEKVYIKNVKGDLTKNFTIRYKKE